MLFWTAVNYIYIYMYIRAYMYNDDHNDKYYYDYYDTNNNYKYYYDC